MKHFIALLLLILLLSCEGGLKNKYNNTFLKGIITIRAEENYPIGMIKVSNIDSLDILYEEPSRGILYKYDVADPINLHEYVSFQIDNSGCIQVAKNISSDLNKLSPLKERVDAANALHLNLHLADQHREGPFHKKGHIKVGGGMNGSIVDVNLSEVGLVRSFLFSEIALGLPSSYEVYFIRIDQYPNPFDDTVPYYLALDKEINSNGSIYRVATLSLTHDHVH